MGRRPLPPGALLWACAYLGCLVFLLADLVPRTPPAPSLLAQLSWLSLVGSIPVALLLGAASRAAEARPLAAWVAALVVAGLVSTMAWEHTDVLLSGPRFIGHPHRLTLRVAMNLSFGVVGALAWLWLVWGMRVRSFRGLGLWLALSALAVVLLGMGVRWYRAYDFTAAQLVLPAAVCTAAMVYVCALRWKPAIAVLLLALAGSAFGAVSRFVPSMSAVGERELIAASRSGALVTLYVLPHVGSVPAWPALDLACPPPSASVNDAPIRMAPEARRSVILISVDALRKDAMTAHVEGHPVMPELSRLAQRGVSFQKASSTYPATLFAVGSAFTGLSPAELYLSPKLPETIFSRSRSLVDRQIAVLPDVSWFRLPIVTRFLAPNVEPVFAPDDRAATNLLIERLQDARAKGASVMAWAHYYSPHEPYVSGRRLSFGRGKKNAYLAEVAYFDLEIGRLLAYLTRDGWLSDSLVVFFSDHGEALGELSYWGHHVYLNGWMVDVPLILWHADLPPARPEVGVSLADVAPTVLHFLGLPIPLDIEAQSLFTLDPSQVDRPTFSEAFPVRGRELFDSFQLPALDDRTIADRLRSIRVANEGYEPKGAVTRGPYRMVHHRAADAWLLYERKAGGAEVRIPDGREREVRELLESELVQWEQGQLHRIQCRLKVEVGEPRSDHQPESTPAP